MIMERQSSQLHLAAGLRGNIATSPSPRQSQRETKKAIASK